MSSILSSLTNIKPTVTGVVATRTTVITNHSHPTPTRRGSNVSTPPEQRNPPSSNPPVRRENPREQGPRENDSPRNRFEARPAPPPSEQATPQVTSNPPSATHRPMAQSDKPSSGFQVYSNEVLRILISCAVVYFASM
jgi:hypothetical protein